MINKFKSMDWSSKVLVVCLVILLLCFLASTFLTVFGLEKTRPVTAHDLECLDKQINCYGTCEMANNYNWTYHKIENTEWCNVYVVSTK